MMYKNPYEEQMYERIQEERQRNENEEESYDDAFRRNWHGGDEDPIESGDIAGG